MTCRLPEGFRSALDSRHLCNLDWQTKKPPRNKILIVQGTTGTMHPKDVFIALAFHDPLRHPKSGDHWFDMNNDHLTDQGWYVTHWCEL